MTPGVDKLKDNCVLFHKSPAEVAGAEHLKYKPTPPPAGWLRQGTGRLPVVGETLGGRVSSGTHDGHFSCSKNKLLEKLLRIHMGKPLRIH